MRSRIPVKLSSAMLAERDVALSTMCLETVWFTQRWNQRSEASMARGWDALFAGNGEDVTDGVDA